MIIFTIKKVMAKTVKHIGFQGAEKKVMKEGFSKKTAGAIVASASRKAVANGSKNKMLKKVKGK